MNLVACEQQGSPNPQIMVWVPCAAHAFRDVYSASKSLNCPSLAAHSKRETCEPVRKLTTSERLQTLTSKQCKLGLVWLLYFRVEYFGADRVGCPERMRAANMFE